MNNDFNQNNGFEQDGYTTYVQTPKEDKNGKTAQLLGIIALIASAVGFAFAGLILALVSFSYGKKSLLDMGTETQEAKNGRICSVISIVLFAISMVVAIISVIAFFILEANIAF